jgi:hypothetical protein
MQPSRNESLLLKLRAKDAEDIQVISAVLQDAIAPVCDMTFMPEKKNFVMVVHRLRHEEKSAECLERICCAFNLSGAEAVQTHGFDLHSREQMLDLLAVLVEGEYIHLVFAGEAKIRIQTRGWSLIIEDFGEAWPASCTPCHEAAQS